MIEVYRYNCQLIRVIDGDTIVLDIDQGFDGWLRNQSVRLVGVDTPEVSGKHRPAGIFVTEIVRIWLNERAVDGWVQLKSKYYNQKGSFGRILGEIYATAGPEPAVSLNQYLVANKLGWGTASRDLELLIGIPHQVRSDVDSSARRKNCVYEKMAHDWWHFHERGNA